MRANPEQETFANLPIGNVLALAPAGCGKTEALALRARTLLSRGDVVAPRKILALTFSNKARDNLASRMSDIVGRTWQRRVSVMNFHGLAARVVRSHAAVIGLAKDFKLPTEPWRSRARRELGISYKNSAPFEEALRRSKNGPFDDESVLRRVIESGNAAALEYERRLRAETMLDHDDLLRHLARLLLMPAVQYLYREHFRATLIDEVQDLSALQFEIVRGVGAESVTYVGDPAQGIYSFAGADPDGVLRNIRALNPSIIEFKTSYRSSPRILETVNAVARAMGTTELVCGTPERWPLGGRVIYLERGDTNAEADALLALFEDLRSEMAGVSIGVLARRGSRLDQLRSAALSRNVPFEDWTTPVHVPHIVVLLKRFVRQAAGSTSDANESLRVLEALCRATLDATDATSFDELSSACANLQDMMEAGRSLSDAVALCKSSVAPNRPVVGGLHLLNGHKGKGQEFDWVAVIGLEDGHVPHFENSDDPEELRVLHVMLSRAKSGLVLTYARQTMTRYGWRSTEPSRWLPLLRDTVTEVDIE